MSRTDNDAVSTPAEQDAPHLPAEGAPQEPDTQQPDVTPLAEEPDFIPPVEKKDRKRTKQMPDEPESTVDYITSPRTRHRSHSKNGTTHKGKTKTASPEEMQEAEEGFVFRSFKESDKQRRRHHRHHHHHHKHKSRIPKWLKVILIIVSVLLAIVIALVGTFFILREIGRKSMHDYEDIKIVLPATQETEDEPPTVINRGRTIVYNGVTYEFNEDVVCIGFVGVDKDISNENDRSMGDAVNIIAFDTESGALSVIAVSRDTMTDVNLYSVEGKYIDTERLQITYAYSFGNQTVSGGENTATSLSRLFFGLPVNHYFALNLDALMDLTDAIGGVTLTSSMDFYSYNYKRNISVGETITLYDDDARSYVRKRNINELDSNSGRMQRQQEFIRAFLSQVIPAVKNDLSLVTQLYSIVDSNSESNLDLPKIVYLASELASKLESASEIRYLTVSGETVPGVEHAEFYADDQSVLETMLDVFYRPVP